MIILTRVIEWMFVNIKISKEGNKISPASNIQQGIASVRRLTEPQLPGRGGGQVPGLLLIYLKHNK